MKGISKKLKKQFYNIHAMYEKHIKVKTIAEITGFDESTIYSVLRFETPEELAMVKSEEYKRKYQERISKQKATTQDEAAQLPLESIAGDSEITIKGNKEVIEALFRLVQALPGVTAGASI